MAPIEKQNTSLGRRSFLAMTIVSAGLASASSAYADADLAEIKVVDRDTGQELQIWPHHGRLFVAGEPGARYGLRLTNHTSGRVLLVLSVDGVNILTGETRKYDQRGYVLDAHQSYDVNGWRKSDTEIAAFAFAPLPQSYAARTGRPGDVGVIGMAVFQERANPEMSYSAPPTIQPERRRPSSAGSAGWARAAVPPPLPLPPVPTPAPSFDHAQAPSPPAPPAPPAPLAPFSAASSWNDRLSNAQRDWKLGTAHGAREWSVAATTTFMRATTYPLIVRQIEYDTYSNLVAQGVIRPSSNAEHRPRPFPLDSADTGFVPDPPIGR